MRVNSITNYLFLPLYNNNNNNNFYFTLFDFYYIKNFEMYTNFSLL